MTALRADRYRRQCLRRTAFGQLFQRRPRREGQAQRYADPVDQLAGVQVQRGRELPDLIAPAGQYVRGAAGTVQGQKIPGRQSGIHPGCPQMAPLMGRREKRHPQSGRQRPAVPGADQKNRHVGVFPVHRGNGRADRADRLLRARQHLFDQFRQLPGVGENRFALTQAPAARGNLQEPSAG